MKDFFPIKIISILLDIIYTIQIISIGMLTFTSLYMISKSIGSGITSTNFINYLAIYCVFFLYFFIVFILRKIVKTVQSKNCFIKENITRFNNIGFILLTLSFIDVFLKRNVQSNLEILAGSWGSLKASFFIYLIMGLLTFVLSSIFKEAIKIKTENELTI